MDALHRALAEKELQYVDLSGQQYWHEQARRKSQPDPFWEMAADNLEPRNEFELTYDMAKARSVAVRTGKFLESYEQAFCHYPPYGLRCSEHERTAYMRESITRLFDNDVGDFDIRAWSDDWSNYFDLGKSWIGTYLWTALHPDGRAIWIGGSVLD